MQQVEGMEQDIVKVHCVRLFEAPVIVLEDEVEFSEFLDGMDVGIRFAGVLGPADMRPYRPGVLAVHIETVFQNIFYESDLIGPIVDGDRIFETDLFRMRLQDLEHRGMEGPHPGKILYPSSRRFCEPIFQLVCRFVRKSDAKDPSGFVAVLDQVLKFSDDGRSLARSRARANQGRSIQIFNCCRLHFR